MNGSSTVVLYGSASLNAGNNVNITQAGPSETGQNAYITTTSDILATVKLISRIQTNLNVEDSALLSKDCLFFHNRIGTLKQSLFYGQMLLKRYRNSQMGPVLSRRISSILHEWTPVLKKLCSRVESVQQSAKRIGSSWLRVFWFWASEGSLEDIKAELIKFGQQISLDVAALNRYVNPIQSIY